MSDTPRTDDAELGYGKVTTDFARQLERELNEANVKIIRLEKAGDELLEWLTVDGVSLSNQRLLANQWYRAKGIKK